MNINNGINRFRMLPQQQKLNKNIVDKVKKEIIEKTQETSIEKSDAAEGYGNASSQQYLANMNIQFISRNNANRKPFSPQNEPLNLNNDVINNTIDNNIEQIETETLNNNQNETPHPLTKSAAVTMGAAASVASTGAASAASTLGQEVLRNGSELLGEYSKYQATVNSTSDLAQGIKSLGEAVTSGQYESLLFDYADNWMVNNGINEITAENVGNLVLDFLGDNFAINLKSLGKMVGTTALTSLAIKVGVETLIDVLPGFLKDAGGVCKDWWNNIKSGNIGGALKNVVVDVPMVLLKTAGNTVKHLAINTWDTAVSVVKPVAVGAWNTVKTAAVGTWNTVKAGAVGVWNTVTSPVRGVIAGGKALVNGFKNGIQNFKDGNILQGVGNILGGTLKAIGKPIDGIINIGTNAVKTVWNVASNAVKTVWNTAGEIGKTISNVTKAVFGEPVKTVVNAVKTAGKVVVEGAKAVGKGIAKAANWVANGAKKLFKGW